MNFTSNYQFLLGFFFISFDSLNLFLSIIQKPINKSIFIKTFFVPKSKRCEKIDKTTISWLFKFADSSPTGKKLSQAKIFLGLKMFYSKIGLDRLKLSHDGITMLKTIITSRNDMNILFVLKSKILDFICFNKFFT